MKYTIAFSILLCNLLTSCVPHSQYCECRFKKKQIEDVVFYTWEKCEEHSIRGEETFDP